MDMENIKTRLEDYLKLDKTLKKEMEDFFKKFLREYSLSEFHLDTSIEIPGDDIYHISGFGFMSDDEDEPSFCYYNEEDDFLTPKIENTYKLYEYIKGIDKHDMFYSLINHNNKWEEMSSFFKKSYKDITLYVSDSDNFCNYILENNYYEEAVCDYFETYEFQRILFYLKENEAIKLLHYFGNTEDDNDALFQLHEKIKNDERLSFIFDSEELGLL